MKSVEINYREMLSEYSKVAYARGLTSDTGGNISVRMPKSDHFLITPGGLSLKDVSTENSIEVDFIGNIVRVSEGFHPSKKTRFHGAIYDYKPQINAIFHLHPPYSTAFASMDKRPLLRGIFESICKEVIIIPYAKPGSIKLRNLVIDSVKENPDLPFYLMAHHGVLIETRYIKLHNCFIFFGDHRRKLICTDPQIISRSSNHQFVVTSYRI